MLPRLFNDCFLHLGCDALYQIKGQVAHPISVLIKQPDTAYELGDAQVIGRMAIFEVKVIDIPSPQINDTLIINQQRYKVYQPPLKDSSNMLWELQAMVMEA
jgi:hypothetical protein